MSDFFSYRGGMGFKFGNSTHIITIALLLISIFLLYKFRDRLKKWKYKDKMRYVIAAVLFMNMTIYYISLVLNGIYNWKTDLPFHLCFITGYVFMFSMLTGNKQLYKVVYFFTFVGPIPAIILPDTTQGLGFELGPDRFIYYQYVISHHIMLISSLYALWVLDYKIELKDMFPAFIYGNLLVGMMTIFNYFCDTNYIMVFNLPSHIVEMLPFLKYGTPIIWLEFAAICALAVSYIPVYVEKRSRLKIA